MKDKTIILIIFLLLSLNSVAQSFTGKYTRNNNEYLYFLPDDKIEFLLESQGCYGVEYLVGEGNYKLNKNRITIEVKTHRKDFESTYSQIPQEESSEPLNLEFLIIDENKDPLPYASIVYKNFENKDEGAVSDENGKAELSIIHPADSVIEVSYIGFASAFIPMQDIHSGKIVVTMKEGNTSFIDNRKLKMKIRLDNDNRTFEIEKIKIK